MKRLVDAVSIVVFLLAAGQRGAAWAQQDVVANGNFNAWDDSAAAPDPEGAPNNWIAHFAGNPPVGPDFNQAPGLDGTGNSLQLNPGTIGARGVYQDFPSLSTFEFSFDFAAEAPVVVDQQSLRVTLRGGSGTPGSPIANLRLNANASGTGDLQMFSGSWTTVAEAINFSNFATNNLAVYRVTLNGEVNTGDSNTLRQSFRLFDVSNNTMLVDEELGTGLWQTTPTEMPTHRIFFESTSSLHASYRVDNVSLLTDDPLGLDGDFDEDGTVDGRDFLIWQRGNSPSPLSAEDLADWEANFGTIAPLTAAVTMVPEPSTAGLVLLTLCGLAIGRTRCPSTSRYSWNRDLEANRYAVPGIAKLFARPIVATLPITFHR